MLLLVSPGVGLCCGLLQILVIFSCYLFHILQSNIFLWHLVIDLSFSTDFIVELSFPYSGRSCFICIAWRYPRIFWVSLLSQIPFDIAIPPLLSDLSAVVSLYIFLPWYFGWCRRFFICPSSLMTHSDFVFLFGFRWGLQILSLIILIQSILPPNRIIYFKWGIWRGKPNFNW